MNALNKVWKEHVRPGWQPAQPGRITVNRPLQRLYHRYFTHPTGSAHAFFHQLKHYRWQAPTAFLVSGQSGYFNEQVDQKGLSAGLKLAPDDVAAAQYLAQCFGKSFPVLDDSLSVLYTAALNTVPFAYARQSFPANIWENVWQFSVSHAMPIPLILGESEAAYFLRAFQDRIDHTPHFPLERRATALRKAQQLIAKFCAPDQKNRIYLIPYANVKDHPMSIGDADGWREGQTTPAALREQIAHFRTLDQDMAARGIDPRDANFNYDADYHSEYGIAIYGPIADHGVTYLTVDREYTLMQNKARDLGYPLGATIPVDIMYRTTPYQTKDVGPTREI